MAPFCPTASRVFGRRHFAPFPPKNPKGALAWHLSFFPSAANRPPFSFCAPQPPFSFCAPRGFFFCGACQKRNAVTTKKRLLLENAQLHRSRRSGRDGRGGLHGRARGRAARAHPPHARVPSLARARRARVLLALSSSACPRFRSSTAQAPRGPARSSGGCPARGPRRATRPRSARAAPCRRSARTSLCPAPRCRTPGPSARTAQSTTPPPRPARTASSGSLAPSLALSLPPSMLPPAPAPAPLAPAPLPPTLPPLPLLPPLPPAPAPAPLPPAPLTWGGALRWGSGKALAHKRDQSNNPADDQGHATYPPLFFCESLSLSLAALGRQ